MGERDFKDKSLMEILKDLDYDELFILKDMIDIEIRKRNPKSANDQIYISELGLDPYVIEKLHDEGCVTVGDVFRKYKKGRQGLSDRVKEEVEFILRVYDFDKFNDLKKPENLDKKRK